MKVTWLMTFYKGTYKFVGRSFGFLCPKARKFLMVQIASICYYDAYLSIWIVICMHISTFPRFLKPHKWASKSSKFSQKSNFLPKSSKSTNVGFCANSFDKSLVLILKYTVCEFYDCRNIVYDTVIFWIWKKKKWQKIAIFCYFLPFFFFFQIQNIALSYTIIRQS